MCPFLLNKQIESPGQRLSEIEVGSYDGAVSPKPRQFSVKWSVRKAAEKAYIGRKELIRQDVQSLVILRSM
jgi:hypothetical protein